MKKLLIVILLFFIVTAVALLIFILTFDVNKYKGVLAKRVELAIDKDVRLGNISLNILPALSFRVNGFSIKDHDKSWDEALVRIGSIDARLKLLPLLKKDIEVENLRLRGLEMLVYKNSLITLPKASVAESTNINAGLAAGGALKFLAESISIVDSSVRYIDRNPRSPADIKIDIIDASVKNASLYGPANIEARLSVFGRGLENASISAVLYPEIDTGKPFIKNLEITLDLDRLNIMDALSAFGQTDMAKRLTGKEIKGRLRANAEKLNLDPKAIYDSDIFLTLSDGMTNALPAEGTLDAIDMKSEIKSGDLTIQRLTAEFAGGSVSAKGVVSNLFSSPAADIEASSQNINVSRLLPVPAPGSPTFEGWLRAKIYFSIKDFTAQDTADTLTAKGDINLDRPVLKNINVLTMALDKLNMLPGLVSRLKANLPERYKDTLKSKDTSFKPITLIFDVKNGKLTFQKTLIESDAFYLTGSGYFGLNKEINIHSDFFIPKDLSGAFIEVVRELSYLQNTGGMITMPIDIEGKFPNIYVVPNLDYVIQKLAVAKGQEFLESIFKKNTQKEESGQSPEGTGKEQGEIKPEEAIIRTIFDILSSPKK